MNITIDEKLQAMLLKAGSALGVEVSQVLTEAVSAYFRKLVTDGKIPADEAYSSLSSNDTETEYSLEEAKDVSNSKKYGLSPKERASLGKTQLKNADKAEA
ncbi:MAG: hypothetical protein II869_05225, partial [Synergistaceae bacterium]|nr:hypothetical protein [Synergistaceae bacterium]